MSDYLYGAAVQGIQGFIYQTNKLREIVGASELVELICTELFARVLYKKENASEGNSSSLVLQLKNDPHAVLNSAGNIKYIFTNEEDCRRVARIFPKKVMQFAPGVTVSQSVVRIKDGNFAEAVNHLEKNLRAQRNKPMRDLSLGLTGIQRSRETGLPVTHFKIYDDKRSYLDSATFHKLYQIDPLSHKAKRKETFLVLGKKAFVDYFNLDNKENRNRLPLDIKELTGRNDWIAIIHADGNGLGRIVQKIGKDRKAFREFSQKLDLATINATQKAFAEIVLPTVSAKGMIPFRPIVLGGDDLTVICRADLAVGFTESFLHHFEEETNILLGNMLLGKKDNGKQGTPVFADSKDYLTACAGIAFIKSSFPFHFGYKLAESLCDRAKKDTKKLFKADVGNLPASCLMFHKVQDSFVMNFEEISQRELHTKNEHSFEFGPYYLTKDHLPPREEKVRFSDRWTIKQLLNESYKLENEEGTAIRSHIRNWLTLLFDNPDMAEQNLNRVFELYPSKKDDIRILTKFTGDRSASPAYDVLCIRTINNLTTR